MELHHPKVYPQKWAQILFLMGLCLILYFLNLNCWDLWNPDEPRYAQVAKEMVERGDWILMHYNGDVYAHKPPLFFWLIGLSSYLWQGFSSFAVRFPSALFGTLTILLTFMIGRLLYGSRTGFLSGLILLTSGEFAYISTRGNIDTTLTFFTTAALYCFFHWYQGRASLRPLPPGGETGGGAEREKGQSLSIYGFYVSMALATLAKGPVGFILPLLTSLVYLTLQRDWKALKGMKLLTGTLLLLAIVLSWYLPAVWKGGQSYLHETLMVHSIDRYSKGWAKVRPIYYYLQNFPLNFLPWVLFLPGAIAYGFSRDTIQKRKSFFFLLTWFAAIFLFFSFSKGKRALYLLPLFPATSLMVGKFWEDLISASLDSFRREWVSLPLYGFMGASILGGAAIPWILSVKFPSYLSYGLPVALALVGSSIALFALYRFRNYAGVFFVILGIMFFSIFYTSRVIFPLVDPYKSARPISEEIKATMSPGEKLGIYGDVGTGPYNFYTGIVPIVELEEKEELFRFLRSQERVFCLLKHQDYSAFKEMEGFPPVQLITRRGVGGNDLALISNR